MSAWIVSNRHIDYIVTHLIRAELIAPYEATVIGRQLWRENLRSVAYRYPHDTDGMRPGPATFHDEDVSLYEWQETPLLSLGGIAKTIGCYQYQSCEHPEWEASYSYFLTEKLADQFKDSNDNYTVDYDKTVPWGWPSR